MLKSVNSGFGSAEGVLRVHGVLERHVSVKRVARQESSLTPGASQDLETWHPFGVKFAIVSPSPKYFACFEGKSLPK